MRHTGRLAAIEIIEELLPLLDTEVRLQVNGTIERVTLEPQGEALPFTQDGDRVSFTVPRFTCHQMVSLSRATAYQV